MHMAHVYHYNIHQYYIKGKTTLAKDVSSPTRNDGIADLKRIIDHKAWETSINLTEFDQSHWLYVIYCTLMHVLYISGQERENIQGKKEKKQRR